MKCCDITAGMLREQITLQGQSSNDLGGGARDLTYSDYATVRAMFKQLSGSERLYAERLDATTRNRIIIRYRSDITESDRVKHRGKVYQIRFINNIEMRDKWLEIDLDGGVPT